MAFPSRSSLVAIKTLGPPAITAVAGYAIAWVQARMGRKVRIRIGEFEAEARTLTEIKALLHQAAEFQDGLRTQDEKQAQESSNTKGKC
jgi:hypothetical protein